VWAALPNNESSNLLNGTLKIIHFFFFNEGTTGFVTLPHKKENAT
jgi:hypothetical protein